MTAAAEIAIVVPMKPLKSAKSRLSTALSAEERSNLSLNMLERVLVAASAHAHQVWVVGGDGLVREAASDLGATWTADDGAGLNVTLEKAFGRAARQGLSPMYLPADLPLVEAGDVAGMIDASRGGRLLTLAPASRDGGTNGIVVPAGSRFRPEMGLGSFERHTAQAVRIGAELIVFTSVGFGLDLDVPADLEALERIRPGYLAELLTPPTTVPARNHVQPREPAPLKNSLPSAGEG
jgi:2-phospho-L-lactate guanylyltransferase